MCVCVCVYPNLSSSSFDTTLIISAKIENVYVNIFNDLNVCTVEDDDNNDDDDANKWVAFYSHTHTHTFIHSFIQQSLPITTNTISASDSAAKLWSHAGCKPQDFLTKYLMLKIRFVFIRVLVMWWWFTQITKIFIIPFLLQLLFFLFLFFLCSNEYFIGIVEYFLKFCML